MQPIITVHPSSPYLSVKETLESFQRSYPPSWFYKPVGIEIEITNKCNLKCHGCGQRDESIPPEDILTTDDYITVIKQARDAGIHACSITGGETLLYLERVTKIMSSVEGMDFFKLNTNGYRFVTDELSQKLFRDLKTAGFGRKNKYIKPVLVISVGQQNKAGMPLERSVTAISNFYKVFSFDEAICTVNITDENVQDANEWKKAFYQLFKEKTGFPVNPEHVPIRSFMLNNIPTLHRLKLVSKKRVPIRELILSFKSQYSSWKCLNLLPETVEDLTTLTPKCVLRPNGDLIACPGYNYVHLLGNVRDHTVAELIEKANTHPILSTVFTSGLEGLLNQVESIDDSIKQEKLSISYAPCDVCQHLTNHYNQKNTNCRSSTS